MMKKLFEQYAYEIPEASIRKEPVFPRDASRLFVYDTKTDTIQFDYFYNLANYIPASALVVLNNTGVIPARVEFAKDTGGKVGGLVLVNEGFDEEGNIAAIVDRQIIPGRKVVLGEYSFFIVRQDEQKFYLKPEFDKELLPEILEKYGTTPTPPYLGKQSLPEHELRDRYQTIFAQEKKSVAAPTASLHFTPEVFQSLKEKGIVKTEVTLDVGLGTFAEVKEEHIKEKRLHTEKIFIPKESFALIKKWKEAKKLVLAVGTTATRTLESQAKMLLHEAPHDIYTDTNLFLMPGDAFHIVDCLMTNFHVPRSSLMALVDAFLKHKKAKRDIKELYEIAIKEGFAFYSFGDSMLIL